jgi:hypothetical protein
VDRGRQAGGVGERLRGLQRALHRARTERGQAGRREVPGESLCLRDPNC